MTYANVNVPAGGEKITFQEGKLSIPENPILLVVEGDGVGRDIWRASRRVFDASVEKAYQGGRKIHWMEVFAGEKSNNHTGSWLPDETLHAFNDFLVGIIGPLSSPFEGGIRTLNEALHKALDLYACQRPMRYFHGLPSPAKNPQYVDMVVFRENTEDIYAGIEFENGSDENRRFKDLFHEHFPADFSKMRFPASAGIGLKPVSKEGTERLVRAAIRWALENKRRNVTLVHKGNIMKFTEGAFRNWGYALAEREYGEQVYTWAEWERCRAELGEEAANAEQASALEDGKLLIKDVIADIVFQQTITRAREFDVLATMNMNGDYLSNALAAQVGGISIAPEGDINYLTGHAVFEATHDTAPQYADKDIANPGSMILSGEMMLRYMGWNTAADLIIKGMQGAITAKTVTFDYHKLMEDATLMQCSEFGEAVIQHMHD